MAPQSLTTIITILLFTLSTTTSSPHTNTNTNKNSKPSKQFIKSSCNITQYPSLCYHYLSPFSTKINQSERQLALTALALSLSQARTTTNYVSKTINKKAMTRKDIEAIKDCIDIMGDSVDQLSKSFIELGQSGRVNDQVDFMWHMSNVQTWVSAALTDANTCMDGCVDINSDIKSDINVRLNNVAQLTSNALALVNTFANSHY